MRTWLEVMVRRGALRALAVVVGVLCIAAFGLFYFRRPLSNAISGPFPFAAGDLDAIGRAETAPRYFVTVTGAEAFETGINLLSVQTTDWVKFNRRALAAYYAVTVGNKYLIVETSSQATPRDLVVTGTLEPFSLDFLTQLEKNLGRETVRMGFYPFFLKIGSIKDLVPAAAAGLGIVMAVLFVVAGPGLAPLAFPSSSPALKRVPLWGDPHLVSAELEREYRSPEMSFGPWRITDRYLFQTKLFSFDVQRLEDVLWVYKRSSPAAYLVRYDGMTVVDGPDEMTDELVAFASKRIPWAVFGYSEETWRRTTKDPDLFRDEVLAAKKEHLRR